MCVILSFSQVKDQVLATSGERSHTAIREKFGVTDRDEAVNWLCAASGGGGLDCRELVPDPHTQLGRAPDWFSLQHLERAEGYATEVMGSAQAFLRYCATLDDVLPPPDDLIPALRNGLPSGPGTDGLAEECRAALALAGVREHCIAGDGGLIVEEASSNDKHAGCYFGQCELQGWWYTTEWMPTEFAALLRLTWLVPEARHHCAEKHGDDFWVWRVEPWLDRWRDAFADPANRIPEWRDERAIEADLKHDFFAAAV